MSQARERPQREFYPGAAVLALYTFPYGWNDFLWPLIVLQDESKHTIQIALRTLNDTYYVDNAGDSVLEGAGEGDDWVACAISYTLGANLEGMNFIVAGNMNGTGNELDNRMHGNGYVNVLTPEEFEAWKARQTGWFE